jgi:hypothetical protein
MNTQDNAKYFVSHPHHDHHLVWILIVVLSSLTLGLLPIVNFFNVPAPENVVPHEAELWGSMGAKD